MDNSGRDTVTQRRRNPIRVAVAAGDRSDVVQHFGRASRFVVCELSDGRFRFVENRLNVPPCTCPEGEHENMMEQSARLLEDCRAVVVARIGPGAAGVLRRHGKEVHVVYDFIETALEKVAKESLTSRRAADE